MHTYKINTAPIAALVRPKKPRKKSIDPSEHDLQVSVMKWARFHETQHQELALLHAIPNGGLRHVVTAFKMQAEGAKPGIPDLCLPVARHGFHGLYIEMKTNTGKLRETQAWWLDKLNEQGYMAVVCRGDKAAIDTIKSYLGIV